MGFLAIAHVGFYTGSFPVEVVVRLWVSRSRVVSANPAMKTGEAHTLTGWYSLLVADIGSESMIRPAQYFRDNNDKHHAQLQNQCIDFPRPLKDHRYESDTSWIRVRGGRRVAHRVASWLPSASPPKSGAERRLEAEVEERLFLTTPSSMATVGERWVQGWIHRHDLDSD